MKSYRDIAERAVLTFLQAFLAVMVGNVANIYDVNVLQAAGTAGLASLISYLYHVVSNLRQNAPDELQ